MQRGGINLSKELTSLLCSSYQLSTEDQEKEQVSEKSGAENEERGEEESQAPGEKTRQTCHSVQMVAPGDSIWVFTQMEPNLGILHCQYPGSTKEQIQQSTLPPSIIDTNPRLLKRTS